MPKMLANPAHEANLSLFLSEEELNLPPMTRECLFAERQMLATGLIREMDLIVNEDGIREMAEKSFYENYRPAGILGTTPFRWLLVKQFGIVLTAWLLLSPLVFYYVIPGLVDNQILGVILVLLFFIGWIMFSLKFDKWRRRYYNLGD